MDLYFRYSNNVTNLFTKYEHQKYIVIIGSSTGGNFAYQLADSLRNSGVKVKLIMINPLLQLTQRITSRPFPAKLATYLCDISEVNQCAMIISNQDEVIDHNLISLGKDVKVIKIQDNHKLKDIKLFIRIIKGLL
ncbi:alpha/beta hydrolase fold domain-containing protein [Sphingobacteriaceae bacterium WQ 2009]|uniref:Alpha/beta hydrolase fold domain-containing protein n=1 Tax=Rhinopithecimicrobium faecis TaxID=2820698 RepID=A0A8T4HDC0_9SPHI|nr:alpha/beta hydrolase fold domain-containing protein [Sphingobacteriaceae bacterium WQ 2009]